MISITHKGSFSKTESFLNSALKRDITSILDKYGKLGVSALSKATPLESGRAASSWSYKVERKGSKYSISWYNSDKENGFPVAIMIQYGYGTGTGGYVHGRDYINPAMRPVFDRIADQVWKAVIAA